MREVQYVQDILALDNQRSLGEVVIYFDGGCRPTNPGNRYGSFEIIRDGESVSKQTFELGWGTNNEAEWLALIRALDEAVSLFGFECGDYRVKMFTDATIVRNRIMGTYKKVKSEPQRRMAELKDRVMERLRRFGDFSIEWQGRENNLKRFGH